MVPVMEATVLFADLAGLGDKTCSRTACTQSIWLLLIRAGNLSGSLKSENGTQVRASKNAITAKASQLALNEIFLNHGSSITCDDPIQVESLFVLLWMQVELLMEIGEGLVGSFSMLFQGIVHLIYQ